MRKKLILVMLFNIALIFAPVQVSFANAVQNSHEQDSESVKVKPCKHAKTISEAGQKKISIHAHQHAKAMSMADEMNKSEELTSAISCQCDISCADCYSGHANVVVLNFNFFQLKKLSNSPPLNKGDYFKQISLPVVNPPPVV